MIRVNDDILLSSKIKLIKLHFYIKYCIEGNLLLSDGDLLVLSYLYLNSEINTNHDMITFYDICIANNAMGTHQSVRNSISRLHNMGLIKKDRKNHLVYRDDNVLQKFNIDTELSFKYNINASKS